MILPPANHVVEAGDLRVELGDVVTIGEEPGNGDTPSRSPALRET